MGKKPENVKTSDKLCWECEIKVKAKRVQRDWGVGDLIMLVITAGFWIPIWLMYDAIVAPWRCEQCEKRIEPWYRAMGRRAAFGFGGVAFGWIALPGLITVISNRPAASGSADGASRSAQAIDRTKAEREKLESEFAVNRDQIVGDVRASISKKQYAEAAKKAAPYLFLKDPELAKSHALATRMTKEADLLRKAANISVSDYSGNVKLYAQLVALDPTNHDYKNRHDSFAALLAEHDRALAAKKAEADALIAKFGDMPAQSAWDGSYFMVENYLKQIANDPDSIEIDACTAVSRTKDGWLVGCDYRGRNGFGGMIRQSNWFTIRHLKVVAMHDADAYKL